MNDTSFSNTSNGQMTPFMSEEVLNAKEFTTEAPPVITSVGQLQAAVIRAKMSGEKTLAVTTDVLQFLLSGQYDAKTGFMIYQDVFLIEDGRQDEVSERLAQSMEEKLFPGSPSGTLMGQPR